MRLQVFLSRNGVCSRRKAFDLIKTGVVSVNQKAIKEPSTDVDPTKDRIEVKGKRIESKRYEYILLFKPKGYVTTKSDRHADRTILDLLPKKLQYLSPVGRLDKNTEGLLLLTNDGDAAYTLTHPKFDVDKVYHVKITGDLNSKSKQKLENGIVIEKQKTAPAKIKSIKRAKGSTLFTMIIHEGKKRQIRVMLEKVGHRVIHLKRVSQGPLKLGTLKKGCWRNCTDEEISKIKKLNTKS